MSELETFVRMPGLSKEKEKEIPIQDPIWSFQVSYDRESGQIRDIELCESFKFSLSREEQLKQLIDFFQDALKFDWKKEILKDNERDTRISEPE